MQVPYAFDVPTAKIPDLVRSTADQLEAAISNDPQSDTIVVGEFEIKRIEDFQDVLRAEGSQPGGNPAEHVDPVQDEDRREQLPDSLCAAKIVLVANEDGDGAIARRI